MIDIIIKQKNLCQKFKTHEYCKTFLKYLLTLQKVVYVYWEKLWTKK